MKVIQNAKALKQVKMAEALIIDVRERAEFREGHLPAAINYPLSEFSVDLYRNFPHQKICLICNSQNRAKQVYTKLVNEGLANVCVMTHGYDHLEMEEKQKKPSGWTIDRQFRITLGVLMVIFLVGFKFVGNSFLIIPIILATGLVITSIIDRCYMRMGIALLPWNRGKKV